MSRMYMRQILSESLSHSFVYKYMINYFEVGYMNVLSPKIQL